MSLSSSWMRGFRRRRVKLFLSSPDRTHRASAPSVKLSRHKSVLLCSSQRVVQCLTMSRSEGLRNSSWIQIQLSTIVKVDKGSVCAPTLQIPNFISRAQLKLREVAATLKSPTDFSNGGVQQELLLQDPELT